MSSNYYGGIAGDLADAGVDAGFCEDGWHDCGGYCGNCGIHLNEHGTRCGEYAAIDLRPDGEHRATEEGEDQDGGGERGVQARGQHERTPE